MNEDAVVEITRGQLDELCRERDRWRAEHDMAWKNVRILEKARQEQDVKIARLRAAMSNIAGACRIWGGEAERARQMIEYALESQGENHVGQ